VLGSEGSASASGDAEAESFCDASYFPFGAGAPSMYGVHWSGSVHSMFFFLNELISNTILVTSWFGGNLQKL